MTANKRPVMPMNLNKTTLLRLGNQQCNANYKQLIVTDNELYMNNNSALVLFKKL